MTGYRFAMTNTPDDPDVQYDDEDVDPPGDAEPEPASDGPAEPGSDEPGSGDDDHRDR